jgi:hypothetical protein
LLDVPPDGSSATDGITLGEWKKSAFSLKLVVVVDCYLFGMSYDRRFTKNVVMKELLDNLIQIYRRS